MNFIISLIVAIIILLIGVIFASNYRKNSFLKKHFDITRILIIMVFLSSSALLFPFYLLKLEDSSMAVALGVLMSFHNSLRMFVLDGDFEFLFENKDAIEGNILMFYELFLVILYIMAPILTFSFVLSFFKDLRSNIKLLMTSEKDVFVFSELNDRTTLLAESIHKENSEALLIFTDVFELEGEEYFELFQRINRIDGLCFKKDIVTLNLKKFGNKNKLVFFLCSDDSDETIGQFIYLNNEYSSKENCELYYFSKSFDSEYINQSLSEQGGKDRKIKVYRVNDSIQLVLSYFYDNGFKLFNEANNNHISVVINGLDDYGQEMLKGLIWYLVVAGYTYEINCFDEGFDAESKIKASMPEVFLCDGSGQNIHDKESFYDIKFHSGIKFDSIEYQEALKSIKNPTFVFTSLGSDSKNVEVLRESKFIIERNYATSSAFISSSEFDDSKENCRFVTVIKNSSTKKALQGYIGDKCEFIGDNETIYSYGFVNISKMEQEGLDRHIKCWNGEPHEFFSNEYNYASSIASALHIKLRKDLNIPGANLPPDERSDEDRLNIRIMEHNRWNAFVRTYGYVYNKNKSKKLKFHSDLVPFDELTPEKKA